MKFNAIQEANKILFSYEQRCCLSAYKKAMTSPPPPIFSKTKINTILFYMELSACVTSVIAIMLYLWR
jgi:hypothetical protein